MSDWVTKQLGDIVKFGNGKARPKTDGDIPVFGGNGILGHSSESNYQDETIIIGRVGAYCGSTYYENRPIWVSDNALSAKAKTGFFPKYAYYVLKAKNLNQYAQGSSHPLLTQGLLNTIDAYVTTDTATQESIAHIISTLEEKIENNRRMNETLERMAQAIFKSWFVDFDPVRAKVEVLESGGSDDDARLAAMQAISGKSPEDLARLKTENPESYAELKSTAEAFPSTLTDFPLGPIPEGWEFKRIEDSINRLSVGKKFSSKTASTKGKVPILDQGKSGLIGFHDEEPGVRASPEDPVIVFANHTCYMRLIMHDFSAIQNVLPFKPKNTHILWLYYATQGKQSFVEYKGHWPDFAIKEIIIPNNNLDEIYARYISSAVKKIFANELENQSLAETRDALLPKLLSGEIDVSALSNTGAA